MNKKVIKILSIFLAMMMLILMNYSVFAISGKTLVNAFQGELPENSDVKTTSGENILRQVIGPVLSVVRIVAVGISIIMITFLGIKYMSAAPSEKANIKNQLITFTIGAIVVVGATTLLGIVKNFADNTTK